MPIPLLMASCGDLMVTGAPFRRISPWSGASIPKKHLHQSTLSRTVLTQQGMNLSLAQIRDTSSFCNHTIAVNLHDVVHLQYCLIIQFSHPVS